MLPHVEPVRPWIEQKAATTFHPAQVEACLRRLRDAWPAGAPPLITVIEQFPLGEAALLHLFAASSVCATRVVRDPRILLWLADPKICAAPRDYAEMAEALHALAREGFAADDFRALRQWKAREMVRIAARELANVAALEETTAELSQIAEICIRRVYGHCDAKLRTQRGSPQATFAILALGKLGGCELNHSSDVDLLFVYTEDGEIAPGHSYHEFFNELAENILEMFSRTHAEGPLLRVDVRLRPEGSAGPLARSVESMEHYYGGFGETWERLALIKAGHVAGSRELGYDFLRQLQPFIYPKSAAPDLLEEIAGIKHRIERDVVGERKLGRNVKLGRGGIREIEFIVQTLQFIHGARHTFLQEPNTLKAVRALGRLELLPHNEIVDLDRAYRFLRRVEHRLQIESEEQTHTIPADPERLRRFARSLGFDSAEKFQVALDREMTAVRSLFRKVIADVPASRDTGAVNLDVFSNSTAAERAMADLIHGTGVAHTSKRRRQAARRLQPVLIMQLAKTADPDATLTQFVRFVEAHGMRSLLFELLVANPNLLELLLKTLDASRFAADLLVRRPQLLEEITRDPKFNQSIDSASHLAQLTSIQTEKERIEAIREYHQKQWLRILMRDVAGVADLASITGEQTALAEACLTLVNEFLGGAELTIIAMGKFGGRELSYGADLDVLFVGGEDRYAQKLLSVLAQPSPAGNLPRVDARLRPDGEKGPLTCSLATYQQYYAGRAQLWEVQALTRARPITGPFANQFGEIAQHAWVDAGKDRDLFRNIDNMLKRIHRERGSGSEFVDFKTGTGGTIEAEFLVQALQMRNAIWEPSWTRAVDRLYEAKLLTESEVAALKQSYEFLRRCESVLRRYENRPVGALPRGMSEQRIFARRMGRVTTQAFAQEYHAARSAIHQLYKRRIRSG
jgi:[glutamine synthetase] adenylyltransferase / [glutamine synthetase]-adenylyl-L-tyrosine phosphorylase